MARILVVDDEPLIAMMVGDWLSELGHTAIGPAHDLSTALSLAQSDLDAAIVDVSLGDETSYPLARLLASRGVPFAFASGRAPSSLDPDLADAVILAKPFEFAAFQRAVETMLAPRTP